MIIEYSCKVCHLSTIQNNSATTLEKSTSFPLWHQQQNNYPAILNLTCIAAFRSSVSRLISLLACEEVCEWKWVWPRVILWTCYLQLSPALIKIKVTMDTKMVVVFNTRLWLAYLPLSLKFITKEMNAISSWKIWKRITPWSALPLLGLFLSPLPRVVFAPYIEIKYYFIIILLK